MDLGMLHEFVFALMFLMFLVSNYVIIMKFIQFRKKPNTSFGEVSSWMHSFKDGLWWLDFCATTSPLVGLLGTIMALIEAFQRLSAMGISGATEITKAIGFALVATAIGILLSLWNYFFFKFFNSRLGLYKDKTKNKLIQELLA